MEKNFECSVAIQVLPQVEEDCVIPIVDRVIDYIRSAGLPYVVGPFETTIEGDFDTLMNIVKDCQKICIREGAAHVMSYVKIDYCPGNGVWSINHKTS